MANFVTICKQVNELKDTEDILKKADFKNSI